MQAAPDVVHTRAAVAQQLAPAPLITDEELKNMWAAEAKRHRGALVIATISRSGKSMACFGKDVQGKPVNGDTVFELASVSKVFTTLLLAQEVAAGNLQLDAPVNDLVAWKVPRYGKQSMTLGHLAEHSSGLPPWPTNRGNTESPYSSAALQTYLSRCRLDFSPGKDMCYSNAGFALLGDVLADRAHKTFEQLVMENICKPLGMPDTRVHPTKSMASRLTIGHGASGYVMRSSAVTAGGGADGIRSTPNDLIRFVGAFAGVIKTPFEPALQLAVEARASVDEKDDVALGWYIHKPEGIVWKGGNIAGYRTYVAFKRDKGIGVVVLAGNNGFPSPEVGRQTLIEMEKRCR